MAAVPSRRAILDLYSTMIRTSRSFSSYNFREYFLRRTRDTFRAIQAEPDLTKVSNLYAEATAELAVLRRSVIVNQLYGGWKLAVENQERGNQPGDIKTRSDN